MALPEAAPSLENNVRGVILAGGKGSRLLPLTRVMNKHLVRVGNKAMIDYPVATLQSLGLKNILIVTGVEHFGQIADYLGDGSDYGMRFTYKVQKYAGGIAQALALAEDFSQEKNLAVILGDNIFTTDFRQSVTDFLTRKEGAKIFLKEVHDPQRFGVATLENGMITEIVEKPLHPKSNYAVTGFYLYDASVFDRIRTLRPSARGELEITHVNKTYLREGKLKYALVEYWFDTGTFESIERAEEHLRRNKHG